MAGRAIEFLAPPPFVDGSILQFWVKGGNVSLEIAARAFLEAHFSDWRLFSIRMVLLVDVFSDGFGIAAMRLICMAGQFGWAILFSAVRRWIRACCMMLVHHCLFQLFVLSVDGILVGCFSC
jgi:hypothetical protein